MQKLRFRETFRQHPCSIQRTRPTSSHGWLKPSNRCVYSFECIVQMFLCILWNLAATLNPVPSRITSWHCSSTPLRKPSCGRSWLLSWMSFLRKVHHYRPLLIVLGSYRISAECTPFIDTLFNVLRSKSYMPYAPPSPPANTSATGSSHADGGIPIPLDGLLNSASSSSGHVRKRSFDQEDDLRPAKGARLNADNQFSRYGRQDGRGTWQQRGERGGRMNIPGRADFMDGGMNGAMDGMNGRAPYRQQERRGICRDYHSTHIRFYASRVYPLIACIAYR